MAIFEHHSQIYLDTRFPFLHFARYSGSDRWVLLGSHESRGIDIRGRSLYKGPEGGVPRSVTLSVLTCVCFPEEDGKMDFLRRLTY